MAGTKLTDLPDEILHSICFFVNWKDAVSLQASCRRFQDVANEHLLWKYYCRSSFKYWAASNQISKKLADSTFVQWKQLFRKRCDAEVKTRSALQNIISRQKARTPKIETIVGLGYDSKDVLLQNYAGASNFDDNLARRYWSNVALGCLHRSLAVEEWATLRNDRQGQQGDSYERAVAAFDLFILDDAPEGDLDDIVQRLDEYVAELRHAHPDIDDQSPRQKASTTARFLIARNLVGIPEDREYHNIEHNFLGRALFGQEKNSLPIISVIIYCYMVRQLGLSASPCGFPLHVHAMLTPPPGIDFEGDPLPADIPTPSMYMDPFRTSVEIPISSLREQLTFLAHSFTFSGYPDFLSVSTPREILFRCARNLGNSLHPSTASSSGRPIDRVSAQYAALWALVLFCNTSFPPAEPLQALTNVFAENFPHDVSLIEKHIAAPSRFDLSNHMELCDRVRMADLAAPRVVKRRMGNPDAEDVKFEVGQVFRHRRYGYTAVVTGWDGKCDADEEWIERMGVDMLDGGRRQAFYHAFEQDDKSNRYVAEENIKLLLPDEIIPDNFPLEIGKWFKRWDKVENRFISNIRDEYPDD